MVPENPQMTLNDLKRIQFKIENNVESVEDYNTIRSYVTALGIENVLNYALKEHDVWGFDEIILKRRRLDPHSFPPMNITLMVGSILGIIEGLKKHLID